MSLRYDKLQPMLSELPIHHLLRMINFIQQSCPDPIQTWNIRKSSMSIHNQDPLLPEGR
jgi:hypothetical protein